MITLIQPLTYSPIIYSIYRLSGEMVTYVEIVLAFWALINFKLFKGCYFWLLANICISTILDIASLVTVKMEIKNNQPINHLYLLLETITLGLFFITIIKNKTLKNYIKYVLFAFSILLIFNAFWDKGYLTMPGKIAIIENIILVVCSLLLYRQMSNESKTGLFNKSALFWFNLYVLIAYMSVILFFLVINNAMKMSDDVAMSIYSIKNFIGVSCYIFWLIGSIKLKNSKPTATPKPSQQPLERN
jgi:hypothetical protein